jgi:hypothetical protein
MTDAASEPRTSGRLPVRNHLRPKPARRKCVWFYERNDDGDLAVGIISLAYADGLEVEGEA